MPQDLLAGLMELFLLNPVLQFLGSLLSMILCIGSIVLILRKRHKILSYKVVLDTSSMVVNTERIEKDLGEALNFSENQYFADTKLVVLKVWNSGNTAIRIDDYDEPITFNIEEGKVLESKVLKPENRRTPFALHESSNSVILDPIRLRPGDSVSIGILLQGVNSRITIAGNMVGTQIARVCP